MPSRADVFSRKTGKQASTASQAKACGYNGPVRFIKQWQTTINLFTWLNHEFHLDDPVVAEARVPAGGFYSGWPRGDLRTTARSSRSGDGGPARGGRPDWGASRHCA